MNAQLQPLLHDETIVFRAPSQVWSARNGSLGNKAVHGVYFSDTRIVRGQSVTVGGQPTEHIATVPHGADSTSFVSLVRQLDEGGADPGVRTNHVRTVRIDGVAESFTVESRLDRDIRTEVVVVIQPDDSVMDEVKSGRVAVAEDDTPSTDAAVAGSRRVILRNDNIGSAVLEWDAGNVRVELSAPGALVERSPDGLVEFRWSLAVPARGTATVDWRYTASDDRAVVRGVDEPVPWSIPTVSSGDERLERWVAQAVDDLDSLRLSTVKDPGLQFLAAGAPWFLTLFGRDSIWVARFMLPLGTELAADTLRVLAGLQGTHSVAETAEQPGKIMHEMRRDAFGIGDDDTVLPPLYYGTVDATALWVCLLHDAWRWGLPDIDVRELLPHLEKALEWMRDHGDADGDGLLEYIDETGRGLANQGWKDSGDSVQWRDGSLADGPIALCEVQAYAFEAAMHGADLLEHFGEGDPAAWRDWAGALRAKFHESFWIDDVDGAYPAIALDAAKRPVDSVTSNIGHLLGTGLLDDRQSALVARRLVSPQLSSGYGLRTMSTDSAGYWPLSYHGGTVWTHDTAIAIAGLARDHFRDEADELIRGLLAAASGFDYRLPELHSGDSSAGVTVPVPYPAACRPQAWSAASAVSVLSSILGLDPNAQGGELGVIGSAVVGSLSVDGLQFGGATGNVSLGPDGEVTGGSGISLRVG